MRRTERSLRPTRIVTSSNSTGLPELVYLVTEGNFVLLQRLYLSLKPAILDLQTLVTFGVSACHWLLSRGCGIGTCQRNIHVRLDRKSVV